jgi:hypothetical protein
VDALDRNELPVSLSKKDFTHTARAEAPDDPKWAYLFWVSHLSRQNSPSADSAIW